MKSRAYYKGTKIDFGVDDCAKSLPDLKVYNPKQEAKSKSEKKISNRFDALAIDDSNDTEGTENWADSITSETRYTNGW